MYARTKLQRGFTLIEVLTVVAILSVFASVIYALGVKAQARANDVRRIADLTQVKTSLELYYNDYRSYPNTLVSGSRKWYGNCAIDQTWGVGGKSTTGGTGYIPSLAPTYIPVLPVDPKPLTNFCYLYSSDGTDYMLLAHQTTQSYTYGATGNNPYPRPALPDQNDFAFYTAGASYW
jgi:prepilin-type N-terminal cleavage/methylation domain-containing protein